VLVFARADANADNGSLCTGTIVAPRAVLTAAHCVHPAFVGDTAVYEVYATNDIARVTAQDALQVEYAAYDGDFDPSDFFAGNDIAMIVLAEPTSITPVPIQRTRLGWDALGETVRQVGFGMDDRWAQSGAGVKRHTETTLHAILDGLLFFGDIQHSQCKGDSGGPTLLRTRSGERIIGVSSFGSPDGRCFGSFDTRVDTELDFIDAVLSRL
jgi:secreted trypsin-like serine protease